MKTILRKIQSATLALLLIAVSLPSIGSTEDSTKTDNKKESLEMSAVELEELISSLDNDLIDLGDDSVTYEIYDSNDELVFTTTVKNDEVVTNKKFVELMGTSEFFMELDNTLVYRISKN